MHAPEASGHTLASTEDEGLGFFSESLTALFDHHVPAHGEPGQLFTYTPPASTSLPALTVRLPPQAVNSLFAHHVWNSGLRMADTLALGDLRVEGEDVLELGAGAGISGLMAARKGARRVVLSDYDDPAMVANLRYNVDIAFPSAADESVRARLSAIGHSWGDAASLPVLLHAGVPSSSPSPSPSSRRFTRILLADTLWSSAGHLPLLESLTELLAYTPDARICIVAGFHSGRATTRSFLRKARERELVPRGGPWQEVGVDGRKREWGWDRAAQRRESEAQGDDDWDEVEDASERNKWVVEGQLGWSDEVLQREACRMGVGVEQR